MIAYRSAGNKAGAIVPENHLLPTAVDVLFDREEVHLRNKDSQISVWFICRRQTVNIC